MAVARLALASVLAVLVLAGCGPEAAPEPTTPERHEYPPFDPDDHETARFLRSIDGSLLAADVPDGPPQLYTIAVDTCRQLDGGSAISAEVGRLDEVVYWHEAWTFVEAAVLNICPHHVLALDEWLTR